MLDQKFTHGPEKSPPTCPETTRSCTVNQLHGSRQLLKVPDARPDAKDGKPTPVSDDAKDLIQRWEAGPVTFWWCGVRPHGSMKAWFCGWGTVPLELCFTTAGS